MDTLTHALSGMLAARATEPGTQRSDQLPRRTRMWVGFWAAAFPDSDFIVRFLDPFLYVTTHRGLTHSVVMLPIWAVGLAVAFAYIYRKRYSWRAFVGICALGVAAHIVGDVITAFGTMVFSPLSEARLQYATTFIIDPLFSGILIAGLAGAAAWPDSQRPARIALTFLAMYIGFQAVLHEAAVRTGEAYARREQLPGDRVHALPQPFSPFHWMVVVEMEASYHLAYTSLWRSTPVPAPSPDASWWRNVFDSYQPVEHVQWQRVARFGADDMEAVLAQDVWRSEAFAGFRRFAMLPALYRVDRAKDSECAWFNDLRFALRERTMPFRYGACRSRTASAAEPPGAWQLFELAVGTNGVESRVRVGRF